MMQVIPSQLLTDVILISRLVLDLLLPTSFDLTNAGTAPAFVINDTNTGSTNNALVVESKQRYQINDQ